MSLSRQVWLPSADSTGQDQIGCCSHLIGHCLDLVQLPARVRGHPAQVAQEDRQLAQASLKAHLEQRDNSRMVHVRHQVCLQFLINLNIQEPMWG